MPTPPYRADHVGSLLRPAEVAAARKAHFEDKTMSAEELRAVEDKAIPQLIRMQEEVGLKAVTDGECRRSWWHYDFMGMLDGLELVERDQGVQFAGVQLRPIYPTITAPLDFPDDHPMLEHFKFVAANTRVTPKISIPGPSCVHFRVGPEDTTVPEYKDPEGLFEAIARTYKKAVAKFYEAGCRYLQMDDIFFAYLCDPKHRAEKAEKGMDPDWLKAKFEEASKYCDIDQLGIAPQCGFASTEEGNEITEADQRRKLELVVKCAEEIWGGV